MNYHFCFSSPHRGQTKNLFVFSLLIFFISFFSINVNADPWTSNGPMGQSINVFAINPVTTTVFYVGTEKSGVFKSTDSGVNWSPINSGITDNTIYTLAIDPVTTNTVYAGTEYAGVFKSTDGGMNWSSINSGITSSTIYALAIDPKTTTTVYAGTNFGIFKSTDGGTNWSPVNSGITNMYINALAIDPATPTTVYAGILGGGVFKSTDGGANWAPINSGLTGSYIDTLVIDPVTKTTVYAGTLGDGVFKTTDGGASWSPINSGLTDTDIWAIAIDPVTTTTVYAGTDNGVFKTTDGGANWSVLVSEFTLNLTTYEVIKSLAIDPVATATVYAGTLEAGVFVCQTCGQSPNIAAGYPADPLDALTSNTPPVPKDNTITAVAGQITIKPSLKIPLTDQNKQAQLLMYLYYNGTGSLLYGPTISLTDTVTFNSFFPNPINLSGFSGLIADIYYGYLLTDQTIKYNAYELKITQ